MQFYQAGDKSKAICEDCGDVVTTTFAYRDIPFDGGRGVATSILAAVCDRCNRVVALPAQSTPAYARARKDAETPLDVTLTAREMDVLDAAAYRVDAKANDKLRESLIAIYLLRSASDARCAAHLKEKCAKKPGRRANGGAMPKRCLSLNLAPRAKESLKALMKSSGLRRSQIFRGVISQIEEEIVLPDRPAGMKKLRDIADVLTA